METKVIALENSIKFIQTMIDKGGPEPHDYSFFNRILERLAQSIANKEIDQDELEKIHTLFDEDFITNSVHGHSLRKPFGYAGDYLVIDKVYQKEYHPKYERWDQFVLNHRTCDGIRNRKEYFKNLIAKKCKEADVEKIELLNVASGPARDLLECYEDSKDRKKLFTDCVEHDPRAIEYATQLTQKFNDQISYIKGNIYNYDTSKKYDIIWSSGLFDYFDDPSFINILQKFIAWAKPNSEIILGNICPAHSLKDYMEILMKWPLQIRTSKDLIRLASAAGVPSENIKIGIEESGTFLFLHIKVV